MTDTPHDRDRARSEHGAEVERVGGAGADTSPAGTDDRAVPQDGPRKAHGDKLGVAHPAEGRSAPRADEPVDEPRRDDR